VLLRPDAAVPTALRQAAVAVVAAAVQHRSEHARHLPAAGAAKPPVNRIQLSRAVAAASQLLAASRAGAAAAPLPPQPAATTVALPPSDAEREAARTCDARVAKVRRR